MVQAEHAQSTLVHHFNLHDCKPSLLRNGMDQSLHVHLKSLSHTLLACYGYFTSVHLVTLELCLLWLWIHRDVRLSRSVPQERGKAGPRAVLSREPPPKADTQWGLPLLQFLIWKRPDFHVVENIKLTLIDENHTKL